MKGPGLRKAEVWNDDADEVQDATDGRSAWRTIGIMMKSGPTQMLVVFLIHFNLLVLWFEVDVDEGSSLEPAVVAVSYTLSVLFFIEAVLNIVFVPRWWHFGDIRIDVLLCLVVFLADTLVILDVVGRSARSRSHGS